jgi:hypothetical protein
MTPRLTFVILAMLSQTGCVAAIPLATQLMSDPKTTAQLCSMAKLPGQAASLCDRFAGTAAVQSPDASAVKAAHGAPNGTTVNTAAR